MAVRIESQAEPIPGYKLIERLGGGGFGEVWKAEAPGGLHKAIKFVYGDLQATGEDGQRAEQELKAMSRVKTVRHPYILSLERYDIIDGQLIIVMELADRNLWDRFRDCRSQGLAGIPREELLRYMEEAAEALDLMNIEHQLQHLDIKPQNIFLVHNHVKVADFGLVKDLEGMMASVTGGVTPVYAAPETFDGWVSRFCDQYSLAIVYQELLTGQRPFNGTNVRHLIMQHLQTAPNLAPLPAADQHVVARALAKNPEDRYPSCRDFLRALKEDERAGSTAIERPVRETHQHSPASQTASASDTERDENSDTDQIPQRKSRVEQAPVAEGQVWKDTRWIRILSDPKRKEEPAHLAPPRPQEARGDGVLFPALVVGVGWQGLHVLLRMREQLEEEFGSLEVLPNIRWLYIDTDPESIRQATSTELTSALHPGETLLAKLNRPHHYLRTQTGRPGLESWFDVKMLYRIPRSLVTTGMRALGRLAFVDNYRAIMRRLQAELEVCATPEVLSTAAEKTGLGVHTNFPRVYITSGLAGGTGGGMFLDMAYVTRNLLRQRGYERPEIVGAFLLPAADRESNRTLALGNTFAALTELNHFSSPGTLFSARYEEKEKPLNFREAPYNRCVFVEMPQTDEEDTANEAIDKTADLLRRELATPLGHVALECRALLRAGPSQPHEVTCQVFGMHRISWPRRALTRSAASQLCTQIVSRWNSKDATPIKQAVQESVADLWARSQLDGEPLMSQLQTACEQALGNTMEAAFATAIAPLAKIETQAPADQLVSLAAAFNAIEQLVGRADSSAGLRPGQVAEPMHAASDSLIARWGQKLANFAFILVEQPKFRLAGAEEAIRQIAGTIERTLVHYEGLAKEFASRAAEAHERLGQLLTGAQTAQTGNRRAAVLARLVELLSVYPRWRFQSLILQRLTAIYVSLRGRLSDQLREVNFCRTRLLELQHSFGKYPALPPDGEPAVSSHQIFPSGCRGMEDAVRQLSQTVDPEKLQELDAKIQSLILEKFTGLAHVCLTSANLLDDVQAAMQKEAESFVGGSLAAYNIAEMYLAQVGDDTQAAEKMLSAFNEAAPPFCSQEIDQQPKVNILGVPGGPAGDRVREIVRQALTNVQLTITTTANDILFYREISQLPISALAQLGPHAYEAYKQISGAEHFTAHSRSDILEWRAATAS